MQAARIEPEQCQEPEASRLPLLRIWSGIKSWRYSVPVIYLVVALPLEVFLSFLIPPMQAPDESRHFLRAYQLAQGRILPQMDPATHQAGGMLPVAVVDFISSKMTPKFYQNEDQLHTIGARLAALDAEARHQVPPSEKEFAAFPSSAVYAPALYLPQTAGIWLARFFSDKVYVWFHAARVSNAIAAVLMIFFALLLVPGYRLVLLIPAILPMSMYQFANISSDASLIALSILWVALCLRFLRTDGRLLRAGIIACMLLLTLGKPVYLPFALLLLPVYKRLGWRRSLVFCAGVIGVSAAAYVVWAACVRPIFAMAGGDFPGHNPSAQVHFILTHPIGFLMVLLRTPQWNAHNAIGDLIGFFGSIGLPLPQWFYSLTCVFFAAISLLFFLNWRKADRSEVFWGALTAILILGAVTLAAFIMWTPVGLNHVTWVQGRYLIPLLPALAFCTPPLRKLTERSGISLAVLVLAFFSLSTFVTVRTMKHYFFPESSLVGKNIHALFTVDSGSACPATARDSYIANWFSTIVNGSVDTPGEFRVAVADKNGTIWGESDPALSGSEFPFDLLMGSRRPWRMNLWTLDQKITLQYWLIRGNTSCSFGSGLNLTPYLLPPM